MCDHQVAHVAEADVEGAQVPFQGAQAVRGVPAAVDQQVAIVGADQVRVDVVERAIGQRQRQAPHTWQQLRALGERTGDGRSHGTSGPLGIDRTIPLSVPERGASARIDPLQGKLP
jgi:hypothetical protein